MKKIACAAMLLAVSLQAQTSPATQAPEPVKPEAPSQDQPQAPTWERIIRREVIPADKDKNVQELPMRLNDRGYFTIDPLQSSAATATPTPCAIPLTQVRVPRNQSFSGKTVPANKSIDPRMVVPPPLPACAPAATPPAVVTPVAPAEKK